MSRAFVNDDAPDARGDEAPEIKIPVPPGSRNYLTAEGAAALSAELSKLETEGRPGLAAELERAAARGAAEDELSALRRAIARMGRRIEYLSRMAALAEVVEPPAGGYERVAFGATVAVRPASPPGAAIAGGGRLSYRIVGVDEADPGRGLIGWPSPVARALMGKRVGDTAIVKLPEGEERLLVVSIE